MTLIDVRVRKLSDTFNNEDDDQKLTTQKITDVTQDVCTLTATYHQD